MTLQEAYDAHLLLHRLWSRAVGQEGYDKREWQKLERLVSEGGVALFGSGWVARAIAEREARG